MQQVPYADSVVSQVEGLGTATGTIEFATQCVTPDGTHEPTSENPWRDGGQTEVNVPLVRP